MIAQPAKDRGADLILDDAVTGRRHRAIAATIHRRCDSAVVSTAKGDGKGLPERLAARVVVLDPSGAVLLLRYDHGPPNGRHWSTPGGGLEDGEDYRQAALREVREETGWDDVVLGDEIVRQEVIMEYAGRLVRQHERLYLARVSVVGRGLGDVGAMHRADEIAAWRWWALAELETTDQVIWPAELSALLRRSNAVGAGYG